MMVRSKYGSKVLNYELFVWNVEISSDEKCSNIIASNGVTKYIIGSYYINGSDKGYNEAWNEFKRMFKAYNKRKRKFEL